MSDKMRALAFGEVLWDDDGTIQTLGGAPFNVLGHLSRLGGEGTLISAVGKDVLGDRTLAAAAEFCIDCHLVNRSEYQTGKALITLSNGIPSYAFTEPSAWDDISLTDFQVKELSNEHYDAFIFGTLASRTSKTENCLFSVLENIKASEFFFDVNIRLSFYSYEMILKALKYTTILKMNADEVPIISKATGISERSLPLEIQKKFPVKKILITRGKNGSVCYFGKKEVNASAGEIKVLDTVGAGDSLSAAFLFFLWSGLDTDESLYKASRLADYVVARRGAIPVYDDDIRMILSIPS